MCLKLRDLMLEKGVNPGLKSYRSDLEMAPIKAVLSVFTLESVSTCFFTFGTGSLKKNSKSWPDGIVHHQ